MTKKVKLDKLVLNIGDKSIELSPDEGKELHQILRDLFGDRTVFLPSTPVITYPPYRYDYPHWVVTCGDSSLSNGNNTYMITSKANA